ncbi:MAG: hypothetical protein H0U45_01360 [Tatlockia sp.]|nr:hypothetical protein [Tatlockia sp.]
MQRGFDSIGELRIALYWVLDVIFGEDNAPLSNSNAATNWSIIRKTSHQSCPSGRL